MKVDNATLITISEDEANHSCMVVTLQSHYSGSLLGMEKRFFSFSSSESYSSRALFVTWQKHSLVSQSAQEMMGNQIYNTARDFCGLAFFYGSSSEHNQATCRHAQPYFHGAVKIA